MKTDFMLLHSFWISFLSTAERTSDCRKLSGFSWSDIKKKQRQIYWFCLFFLVLFFILICHFCHPFLSGSFAFLCTEACSFQSYKQFKETLFFFCQGKAAVCKCCWWLELSTSSLSSPTAPSTPWLACKLLHLTSKHRWSCEYTCT